jgi:hypothetical protein
MSLQNKKELAESTRKYVIQFLTNLDRHIIEVGPDEAFTEFLCSYGYVWSDFIMKDIVPTGVFSVEELDILNKIESCFFKLLSDHSNSTAWNNLRKEEYLEVRSLTYDFLTLVYDLNFF